MHTKLSTLLLDVSHYYVDMNITGGFSSKTWEEVKKAEAAISSFIPHSSLC